MYSNLMFIPIKKDIWELISTRMLTLIHWQIITNSSKRTIKEKNLKADNLKEKNQIKLNYTFIR